MDYGVVLIAIHVNYAVPVKINTPLESTTEVPQPQEHSVIPVVHNDTDRFHVLRLHALYDNGIPDLYRLTQPDLPTTSSSIIPTAVKSEVTNYQPPTSPVSDDGGDNSRAQSPRAIDQQRPFSPGPPSLDYEGPSNLSFCDSDIILTHYSPPSYISVPSSDEEDIPFKRSKS